MVVSDAEVIVGVLERRSLLRRRDPERGEQILAANVDVVAMVFGADRPLKAGRLFRTSAQIYDSGAVPLVVLTKTDLSDDPAALVARVGESRRRRQPERREVRGVGVPSTRSGFGRTSGGRARPPRRGSQVRPARARRPEDQGPHGRVMPLRGQAQRRGEAQRGGEFGARACVLGPCSACRRGAPPRRPPPSCDRHGATWPRRLRRHSESLRVISTPLAGRGRTNRRHVSAGTPLTPTAQGRRRSRRRVRSVRSRWSRRASQRVPCRLCR